MIRATANKHHELITRYFLVQRKRNRRKRWTPRVFLLLLLLLLLSVLAGSRCSQSPVLPGCLRKAAFVPSFRHENTTQIPSREQRCFPGAWRAAGIAERVARQRQPDWGLRLTRHAPASTNNSCHVDRTVQGNGKLLQAFS